VLYTTRTFTTERRKGVARSQGGDRRGRRGEGVEKGECSIGRELLCGGRNGRPGLHHNEQDREETAPGRRRLKRPNVHRSSAGQEARVVESRWETCVAQLRVGGDRLLTIGRQEAQSHRG